MAALAAAALLGTLLAPVAVAGGALAATLSPSSIQTGFQIDGDKTGGTPPGTFDWESFFPTTPIPNDPALNPYPFAPTGPYTTAQGFSSTGILDAAFSWDNAVSTAACGNFADASGSPGSQTPDTNPFVPGSANVNDKGNLCSSGQAWEVVTDDSGVRHAIYYTYWTRLVGNGDVDLIQILEGPQFGRCDDWAIVFDYESQVETATPSFRTWQPNGGVSCATNPNAPGQWVPAGGTIDFDWAVGVRRIDELGPVPGNPNNQQATFGEFAVDLTTAGLFSPEECTTFAASTMLTRTGNDFGAQIEDYLTPVDPLVLSNCGTLTVTKEVVPAGAQTDDVFGYTVERTDAGGVPTGGIVLPENGDATEIVDTIGAGQTETHTNVLAADNYSLGETTIPVNWALQSVICVTTEPGTGATLTFVLEDASDHFSVYPDTVTDCTITNATSTVTVTKQTLPDGSAQPFDFTIGGNGATLRDGGSVTFAFAPGTQVAISEVIPDGWRDGADITCSAGSPVLGADGVSVTVTTVAAEDVACTFTNTQLATIRVSKEALGTPADTPFDFTGTWTTGAVDPAFPGGGETGVEDARDGDGVDFHIDTAVGDGTNYFISYTNVEPGSYAVTEFAGQAGTLLSNVICTVTTAAGVVTATDRTADALAAATAGDDYLVGGLEVGPGETLACFFVNAIPGQIVVIKQSDPADYEQPFDFVFDDGQATTPFSLTPVPEQATANFDGLTAGQYTVTETSELANWSLTGIVCESTSGTSTSTTDLDAQTAVIDLDDTDIVTCVFTNTADRAVLDLTKSVTGVADGFAWSFDFRLTPATGVTPAGGVQTVSGTGASTATATWTGLVPGETYTLVEDAEDGWSSTLTCDVTDEDAAAGVQFTVEPGMTISCEAANDADAAELTVTKSVEGITATLPWSFTLALDPATGVTPADGVQTVTGTGVGTDTATWSGLTPGERYTVSEAAVAGWTAGSLTCTGVDDLVTDDGAALTFVAQPGQSLECAVTNTADPVSVSITKTATGGDDTFPFVLRPIAPAGPAVSATAETVDGTGIATFTGLTPGGRYSLEETESLTWTLVDFTCTRTGTDGQTEDVDLDDFTVAAGDTIDCAVENEALISSIVIVKNVDGADGDFDFTGSWLPGDGGFVVTTTAGSGTRTFSPVAPGQYEVTELVPDGWALDSFECVDSDLDGPASTVDGAVGTINLDPGETVTCTIANVELGEIVISKQLVAAGDELDGSEFAFTGTWDGAEDGFSIVTEVGDGTAYRETFSDVLPGEYSVTEVAGQFGTLLGALDCTSSEGDIQIGIEDTTAEFTLLPGDTVTCFYLNVTVGQIAVVKDTDPVEYDQAFDFTFTPDGGSPVPFTLNADSRYLGTETPPVRTFPATAGTYTITEIPGASVWTLSDVLCDVLDRDGVPVADAVTIDVDAGVATIVMPDAGVGSCTFLNSAAAASVSVTKTAAGARDAEPWSFDFTLTRVDGDQPADGTKSITGIARTSAVATWEGLVPGATYRLAEAAADGWSQGPLSCAGVTDQDADIAAVTFVAAPGQQIACTIENEAVDTELRIDKAVAGSPALLDDGSVRIVYTITVTNPVVRDARYDLDDELRFGRGITVLTAAVSSRDGITTNPAWDGVQDTRVATDVGIAGDGGHAYDVAVTADVPKSLPPVVADCVVNGSETGSGFLNVATITYDGGSSSDDACAPAPPVALSSTGTPPMQPWIALAIVLLATGLGVLALTRLRRRIAGD